MLGGFVARDAAGGGGLGPRMRVAAVAGMCAVLGGCGGHGSGNGGVAPTPPPTLASVSPASGVQGTAVDVTLTGTDFGSGATVAVSGSGVSVSNVAVVSATSITATFTVGQGASPGVDSVTVATSGGTSGPRAFTVVAAVPTLTSLSPASGAQGSTVTDTLAGTHFASGATVRVSDTAGVGVSNVVVVSATSITATFTIGKGARAGADSVTVTTAGGTSGAQAFTVVVPPATDSVTASNTSPVAGSDITLTAQLVDSTGAAVALAGQAVTWTVSGDSGGTFSPDTSETSTAGVATTTYTTGTSIGVPYTIKAFDADGDSGMVSVTNQPGPVTALEWTGSSHVLVTDSALSLSGFAALNQFGRSVPSPALTFVSRSPAVATVSGSGLVGPVGTGQTMVVASDASNASAADSVLVVVSAAGGPVVRTDLTRFDVKSDTTFTVTLIADMPAGDTLGALTMALTWDPTVLTYVSDAEAGSGVGATVGSANAANGTLLLGAASSSGFAGTVELRRVTFRASATAGLAGVLHLGVTELTTTATFTDLLPVTVAVDYPLITR